MTSTYAPSAYSVQSHYFLLFDRPRAPEEFYDLEFHLAQGDYFGVVAGALGLIIDEYRERGEQAAYHRRLLGKIRHDLASLHKTHTISAKSPRAKK